MRQPWRLGLALFLFSSWLPAYTVQPAAYQQFWLWAGVKPPSLLLTHTQTLYVLQGEISGGGQTPQLTIQGATPIHFPVAQLWLSWRVQRLDWTPAIINTLRKRLALWQQRGNQVQGIQLDFDARTYHLEQYAQFLRQLRQQLPPDCQLSITGLLDWTQTGDANTLNQLHDVVNEIVVQTYRGRHTEANYSAYLTRLNKLTLPFKIGLVSGGDWDLAWQDKLQQLPWYRGEVIFLLNPPR